MENLLCKRPGFVFHMMYLAQDEVDVFCLAIKKLELLGKEILHCLLGLASNLGFVTVRSLYIKHISLYRGHKLTFNYDVEAIQ